MDRIITLSTNIYMVYDRIVLCFLFFCKSVYGPATMRIGLKTPE